MKTILVPTDFSPCAGNALRVAAIIAKSAKAELHLLHSVRTNIDWEHLPLEKRSNYPETMANIEAAEKLLAKESKKAILKGIKVTADLTFGSAHEQILKWANKKLKPDLIVMGSHGPDEPGEVFIGSNAQKTLRFSHCPVLTVKNSFKGVTLGKVVFASNFEENINEPFSRVLEVVKAIKGKIELVFVNTPSNFKDTPSINKAMDKFVSKYKDIVFERSVYNHFMPGQGILEYCKDAKPEMISLVTHGKRHIPHYLLGVAETLVYHSNTPVLSVNIR